MKYLKKDFNKVDEEYIKKQLKFKYSEDPIIKFFQKPQNALSFRYSHEYQIDPIELDILRCILKPGKTDKFARFSSGNSIDFLKKNFEFNSDKKNTITENELAYLESIVDLRNIITHCRISHSKQMLLFPFKSELDAFLNHIKHEIEKLDLDSSHMQSDLGASFEIFVEYESLFYVLQYRKGLEVLSKYIHLENAN